MADSQISFDRIRSLLQRRTTSSTLEVDFSITKQQAEDRYTFGVLYVPGARDSDNEYAEADELQKACWEYFRKGQLRVRDTHTQQEIGEMVELVSWPFEAAVPAQLVGKSNITKTYLLPAGTVYSGVVWDQDAWTEVKRGRLRGYSLGGRAVRIKEAAADDTLPLMRELTAKSAEVAKDHPAPISVGDSVREAADDGTLGRRGVCFDLGVDKSDGVITHDIAWEDDTISRGVRGFKLRNVSVE